MMIMNKKACEKLTFILSHKNQYSNSFILLLGESGSCKYTSLKQIVKEKSMELMNDTRIEKEEIVLRNLLKLYEDMGEDDKRGNGEQMNFNQWKKDFEYESNKKDYLTACELLESSITLAMKRIPDQVICLRILPDLDNPSEKNKVRKLLIDMATNVMKGVVYDPIFLVLSSTMYFVDQVVNMVKLSKDLEGRFIRVVVINETKPIERDIEKWLLYSCPHMSAEDVKYVVKSSQKNFHAVLNMIRMFKPTKKMGFESQSKNSQIECGMDIKNLGGDVIFHKVGRILYNKKESTATTNFNMAKKKLKAKAGLQLQEESESEEKIPKGFYFDLKAMLSENQAGYSEDCICSMVRENYLDFCCDMKETARIASGMARLNRYENDLKINPSVREQSELELQYLTCMNYMVNRKTDPWKKYEKFAFKGEKKLVKIKTENKRLNELVLMGANKDWITSLEVYEIEEDERREREAKGILNDSEISDDIECSDDELYLKTKSQLDLYSASDIEQVNEELERILFASSDQP